MLQKPKSKLFHFGYAKIERFVAFVAAIVIVLICILIAYQAYHKIIYSGVVITHPIGIIKNCRITGKPA